MAVDREHLVALIEGELALIEDEAIRAQIRAMLVEPVKIECRWDYWEWDKDKFEETYPCWMVLAKPMPSRTAIVFCEYGFGPACPWGFLWIECDRPPMGQDSEWSPTSREAVANILDVPPERLMA